MWAAAYNGHLEAAVALLHAGARLNVVRDHGKRLRDEVCAGQPWPGGSAAQFLAVLDATDRALTRQLLLGAHTWLDGGEGGAVLLRANMRLCYGCSQPRPKDGPGATTCPAGCGDPGKRAPAADAHRQLFHEVWYCSPGCVAAAAERHRPVCGQALRWAHAAADSEAAHLSRLSSPPRAPTAAAAAAGAPRTWMLSRKRARPADDP